MDVIRKFKSHQIRPSSPSVRCEGSLAARTGRTDADARPQGFEGEGLGRLPSFEDSGDMAKTDATRGHAGGGREPLVDSAFNPCSRLRQRLPPPPDASPPRSAFLSEFVAKTAASVLPTEPAANARGATASKPPRRKVKFSRHVHGRPLSRRRVANNKPAKRTFQGAPHDLLTFCLCRLPLHAGRARVFGERVRSKRRQDPGAQHVRSDREGFHRLTCPQPPRTPHQAEATHHGQHAYQQADDAAAQQRARRKLDHDGARGERNVAPQLVTPYEGAA